MKRLINQILKFGIVGIAAFIIDYGILYICTEWLGIYYLVSSIISFSISVVFNYIASVIWVFNVERVDDKKNQFILFIVFSIVGLLINQVIMWLGVDQFNYHYMFVKIISTALVMVYNFITRKLFLEKKEE